MLFSSHNTYVLTSFDININEIRYGKCIITREANVYTYLLVTIIIIVPNILLIKENQQMLIVAFGK